MLLDLESPDAEMRPRGRRRGGAAVIIPPPDESGPYAISAVDGAIATSLDGSRATYLEAPA
jgi:hypothetical protein